MENAGTSVKQSANSGGVSTVVFDHLYPLYLYPSNAPGSMSVGIELIGMENYTIWSRAMKLALLGRNKLDLLMDQ